MKLVLRPRITIKSNGKTNLQNSKIETESTSQN